MGKSKKGNTAPAQTEGSQKAEKKAQKKTSRKAQKKQGSHKQGSKKKGSQKKNKPKAEQVLPAYVKHRMAKWDEYTAKRAAEPPIPASPIVVTLPDGAQKEGTAGVTTPMDIANGISKGLAQRVICAKVDGHTWDPLRPLTTSCSLQLLDFADKDGAYTFWHSSAHILGQAIELQFQDARLCIGPPLDDGGFYYDVYLKDRAVTPADFEGLETRINSIIKEKQPFVRLEL
jgi:threonyl-tRNA synthetase